MAEISIVIPAYNEAGAIEETIQKVDGFFRSSGHTYEIIVVDDCSTDDTAARARATSARVISHPTNKGYGNALLTGVCNAAHPWIAITDADGTYPAEVLPRMLDEAIARDLDMYVGARQGKHYDEHLPKRWARCFFKGFTEFVVGQSIPDVNSGLRIIRRDLIARCAPALSGGFSFTTSITIIAFQTGYHVAYRPIDYFARTGKSHVRYGRDTLRALQIIVMTIVLFNPIKLYLAQAMMVSGFTLLTTIMALLMPGLFRTLLLLALGFYAGNVVMALGFLAVRFQCNLSELHFPERGYKASPNDAGTGDNSNG
jgi:glycosyltransferase involved in cell wall biosynthesis